VWCCQTAVLGERLAHVHTQLPLCHHYHAQLYAKFMNLATTHHTSTLARVHAAHKGLPRLQAVQLDLSGLTVAYYSIPAMALMGVCMAVLQGGMLNLASMFPPIYIQVGSVQLVDVAAEENVISHCCVTILQAMALSHHMCLQSCTFLCGLR